MAKKKSPGPAAKHLPRADNVLPFARPLAWARWLKANHASPDGIWIRFYKKDSGVATISYDEALDEALCWGWIDGPVRAWDAQSWVHRFTPRRARGTWSKRNREHVDRLTRAGRMQPAGLAQVEAARADGRWALAYDPPSALSIPDDLRLALAAHPKAEAFFLALNRANLYAISYRLQTAKKPETRARRFEAIVAMMKAGEKFH